MTDVIRKDVTRNLGRLQPATIADIRYTIDQAFGLNTESWNEVCIRKAMEKVFFMTVNRVIVGPALCHNEKYLRYSISFANWLGATSVLVGLYTPWILKPVLGYLGAFPVYYSKQQSMKFSVPVIEERIANIKHKRADPSFDFEEPKDMISWMTQAMLDNPETRNNPPDFIGERLLLTVGTSLTFNERFVDLPTNADVIQTLGAIHTSVMTATNIFLDLRSSNVDARFWEQLREEAASVFKTPDDWNDHASLAELVLADSTIRESLRCNPVLSRTMLREVIPQDGVTLPSGHHLPQGAWLAMGAVGLHRDDRFYHNPNQYDPFRFAKDHEQTLTAADKDNLTDKASIYRNNQSLATASDIYLAFGYGKHSWYYQPLQPSLIRDWRED